MAALRGGAARLDQEFASETRRFGGQLAAVDLHLDRPEMFEAAAREIERWSSGRLDVLVNNAGYGLFGALEDFSEAQLRRQMDTNFFGPVLLTRALLPQLREAQGRVINLSSIAGLVSFPYYGAYSASKFALEGMTEGLYFELKPHGVQVALVEPGGFRTDFARSSFEVSEGARSGKSLYAVPTNALIRAFDRFSSRLGNPEQVSSLLVDLCERKSVPLRVLIGPDARFMALLRWLLPHRLRVWMIELAYRFALQSSVEK